LLTGASKQGQIARLAKAEKKISDAAGGDGIFQLDEYANFLKRNHTLLAEVFCLQRDMRRAAGGEGFWKSIEAKVGRVHERISFCA